MPHWPPLDPLYGRTVEIPLETFVSLHEQFKKYDDSAAELSVSWRRNWGENLDAYLLLDPAYPSTCAAVRYGEEGHKVLTISTSRAAVARLRNRHRIPPDTGRDT